MNRIPLDIESILKIGVDKWYNSFEWPFSWNEFLDLENKMKAVLNKYINKYPKYADIIVINYKIHIEYSNFILALILKDKIGDNAIICDNNYYFKSVFKSGVPANPIINFPDLKPNKILIKSKLKRLKRFISDNKFHFPKFWKKSYFILYESRSEHTLEYLQKRYLGQIFPISFFDFYKDKNIDELSVKTKIEINKLSSNIKNDIKQVIASYGIKSSVDQEKFIENHTNQLFEKTVVVLNAVQKGIKKKNIKLFIGSNNNYYSRILSVAIRKSGGEIHGFKHGEPINYKYDLVSWLDLSLNDFFYEYNSVNANLLKRIMNEFPPLNNNKCIIKSMDSANYLDLFSKEIKINNSEVKTVMLIGNCYRNTSFSSATAVFPTLQLYIELSLIKKLKKKGYSVIYKMHPENLDTRIGFVNNISVFEALFPDNVKINTDKFEDVVGEADAFAFYYTGTSTFGYAINTNKPIYFFNVQTREFPKSISEFLNKRCICRVFNIRKN